MTSNVDKLVKCFQSTQPFVAARVNRNPVYQEIAQELETIRLTFDSGQLNAQIVSRFPSLSQGLHRLFTSHQVLPSVYKFRHFELSSEQLTVQPVASPTLILQANQATGQPEVRYELVAGRNFLIGRDRQKLENYPHNPNDKLLDLPLYRKVSSVHAWIQDVTRPGSSQTWQVADINSTNGTYVNGQKLQDRYVLKSGDRITLAYPTAGEKAPEFVFECPATRSSTNNPLQWLDDCDLIFLVIDPKQPLDALEWQFIDRCSRSSVSEFVIVADTSEMTPSEAQPNPVNFSTITNWIQTHHPSLAQKVSPISLYLRPFLANSTKVPVDSKTQQQYEKICNLLVGLAKERSRQILADRLLPTLKEQIERIEAVITAQESSLKEEQQRTRELLQNHTLEDCREQLQRAIEQVREEKEEFFMEAKIRLGRARDELAESFIQDSLMHKIKQFAEKLEPVVTRQEGQVCIQLQMQGNPDTHQVMLQFCRNQLVNWASEEWQRICNDYVNGEGGLNALIHRSFSTLNHVPSLSLNNSFNPPPSQLNVLTSLQGTFVQFQNDTSYIENSVDNLNFLKGATQVASAVGMAYLNPITGIIQLAGAGLNLVGLINNKLSQDKLRELKLDQATVSLKQQIAACYQRIATFLLKRVAQDLERALAGEDQKFRKSLQATQEQTNRHLMTLKTFVEGNQSRQQTFNQDRAGLEQLKQIIS